MGDTSAGRESVESGESGEGPGRESLTVYFLLGLFLGVIFIKSEVATWFRIQEMFRFQAFHMYGVIGSAVAVAGLSVLALKRTGARTVHGDVIEFPGWEEGRPGVEHATGGVLFGLGWGLVGACPGPLFALIGAGLTVMVVGLLGAVAGAWVYGLVRSRLPHGPLALPRTGGPTAKGRLHGSGAAGGS